MCYCVPFCVTVYTLQVRGSGRLMVTKHALEDSGRSQMVDQLRRAGLYTWTPMERYLRLHGWVVGMPAVHLEQDVGVFRQVMQHSAVKGSNGLEGRVGKEAWLPSLSVESEDGEVWQRLRRCFDAHLRTTSWRQRLPAIVEDVCRNASEGVVDSTAIAACVVRIQWRLLFRQDCQGPDLELMLAARDEWAKTLSLRGPPDPDVRERAFRLVATKVGATFLNTDPDLSTVEFVSTFFQPWLLSPAINVPDLFASLPGFRKKHPEYDTASPHLLVALLDYEHPFPLLERELTRDLGSRRAGDHVFHLQGLGVRGVGSTGIRFGSGPRACPGASVASTLFHHLVLGLQDAADFRPTVNHRWSGRTNDAKGSWFQLGQMARLLFFRWGPTDNVDEWRARYANPDRFRKYGYGSLRLAAFLWCVSAGSPTNAVKFLLVAFLTGMVGALVNVELLYRRMATALLAAVATAWLALPFEQLLSCHYRPRLGSPSGVLLAVGPAPIPDGVRRRSSRGQRGLPAPLRFRSFLRADDWVLAQHSTRTRRRHGGFGRLFGVPRDQRPAVCRGGAGFRRLSTHLAPEVSVGARVSDSAQFEAPRLTLRTELVLGRRTTGERS